MVSKGTLMTSSYKKKENRYDPSFLTHWSSKVRSQDDDTYSFHDEVGKQINISSEPGV